MRVCANALHTLIFVKMQTSKGLEGKNTRTGIIEQANNSKQEQQVDGVREAQSLQRSESDRTDDSEKDIDWDAQQEHRMQVHWELVPAAARLQAGPRVRVSRLPKLERTALHVCVWRTGVVKPEQREHTHDKQEKCEIECLSEAPQSKNQVATVLCK